VAAPADAQDRRGRVVLRMRGAAPTPAMLETAARVARTFRGEVRGVFVKDEDLLALADMPFAREISLTGVRTRALSAAMIRREMEAASTATRLALERLARLRGVATRFEVIAETAASAPHAASEDTGILAVGEPLALVAPAALASLLSALPATAGVVVAGPSARRTSGPVLAAIDRNTDVALLVDTAEQIAREAGERIILLLSDVHDRAGSPLDQEVRAAIDPGTGFQITHVGPLSPRILGLLAGRHGAGLAIMQFNDSLVATVSQVARFTAALACPLLLMRSDAAGPPTSVAAVKD